MSRLAGLLVLLLGGAAVADTASPSNPSETEASAPETRAPKAGHVPLRVVKILADSEQALLFDKNRGRHVLVEVGETIGDYVVDSIDAEEVTLSGKDASTVVLVGPAQPQEPRRDPHTIATKLPDAKAPVDPYGAADAVPADPYDDEPVREASAAGIEPETEGASPVRAVVWGAPAAPSTEPATPAPTTVPATPAAPATGPASPITGPAATAAPNTATLSRKEVATALANFGTLVGAIDASFTGSGLAITQVRPASVFAKAGLTPGDVITAVDGKPLRSLDDAADLYARAGSIKTATVEVVRGGKPQTLRVTIQ